MFRLTLVVVESVESGYRYFEKKITVPCMVDRFKFGNRTFVTADKPYWDAGRTTMFVRCDIWDWNSAATQAEGGRIKLLLDAGFTESTSRLDFFS